MTVATDLVTPHGVKRRLLAKIDGQAEFYWQQDGTGTCPSWSRTGLCCLRGPQEFSSEYDLAEMKLGLSAITFEFDDIKDADGTSHFGKLFGAPARWNASQHYRVAPGTDYLQQINANGTVIPSKSCEIHPAGGGGTIYIGRERISWGLVTDDNAFTQCNRGEYPVSGASWGYTIRRPQEDDGRSVPAIGTVPFSMIGLRISLSVVTQDSTTGTWTAEGSEKLLWTGRISKSIRYVPTEGCWQVTATSITQELDRPVASEMAEVTVQASRGDSPDSSTINIGKELAFEVVVWPTDGGSFWCEWRQKIPANVYTMDGLASIMFAKTNRVYFGATTNPEVELSLMKSDAGPSPKWRIDASANSPTWGEHAYVEIIGTDIAAANGAPYFCHAWNALGFSNLAPAQPGVIFTVDKTSGDARHGQLPSDAAPFSFYHPLHHDQNGGYMYLPNKTASPLVAQQELQNSAAVAYAQLPDAIFRPGDDSDEKRAYTFSYTAKTIGATVNSLLRDKLTLGPVVEPIPDIGGYVGQRADGDSLLLRQVYVPVYQIGLFLLPGSIRGPYEMLLPSLLSTGTPGYNGTYDLLPVGWGLGIQADFVDTQSFLDADYFVNSSALAQRPAYIIDKPVAWSELLSREAKLFGYGVTWRDGKLRCVNIFGASQAGFVAELNDSTRYARTERHQPEISSDSVVNRYRIKTQLYGRNLPDIVITDEDSKEGVGETKELELVHPGLVQSAGADSTALSELLRATLLSKPRFLRYPTETVEVSMMPTLASRVFVGDTVVYSSSYFYDPHGSGLKSTSVYALVLRVGWNYQTWKGSAQLLLQPGLEAVALFTGLDMKPRVWAPSALVNFGHEYGGYDSALNRIYLSPVWFGRSTTDDDDGMRFKAGYKVLIVDRCPSNQNNPAVAGPYELLADYSNASKYITLNEDWTAYNYSKEYIVTFADWTFCPANQKQHATWQVNATSDKFSDGNVGVVY